MDAERKKPKDGSIEELFGCKVVKSSPSDDGEGEQPPQQLDDDSKLLKSLLSQETVGRGRPKALCYEDIQMMIVRHSVTGRCMPAMAVKFIHHKGADNKPKPYVSSGEHIDLACINSPCSTIFYFAPARRLLLCAVSTILILALHDNAFDAPSLVNASAVFRSKPPQYMECLSLRWKASKLKTPVFRRYNRGTLSEDEAMLYF